MSHLNSCATLPLQGKISRSSTAPSSIALFSSLPNTEAGCIAIGSRPASKTPRKDTSRKRPPSPEDRNPQTPLIFGTLWRFVQQFANAKQLPLIPTGATAGIDVYSQEPPDLSSAIFRLPNAVTTPHIAGVTDGTSRKRAACAAENLDRIAAGLEPLYRIDQ